MTHVRWMLLCLSYIVGLISTNLVAFNNLGFSKQQLFLPMLIGVGASVAIAFLLNLIEEKKSLAKINLIRQIHLHRFDFVLAAIVASLAIIYLQLRIPQPQSNDISFQISTDESQLVTISAKVLTEPRLTDSQRLKFILKARQVKQFTDREKVSGKIYATLPLLQGTGIKPGMIVQLTGILYLPQTASLASGFDFKAYLARQGVFAGIQGIKVDSKTDPGWGWWQFRQRILHSQLRGLGSPMGQLVTSMVLGRKAVDLPPDIRDRFIAAGLAHVLAASGFHVSLLLGMILRLTTRFAVKPRLIIGIVTLLTYFGLTGLQASVFRACLMGAAALIALVRSTKVKPLGSLLMAATIILLFDPLFIRDLGFQLSFLATFGLIVTMPELQKRLEWLPTTIAPLIAIPLAASIWVLPLLSYQFNSIATYSIPINIAVTPLIVLISLGGMVSAIAALFVPFLGSAIAWLLYYPSLLLVNIINFFTSLPGSSWATGQISLSVLLSIYGLFLLVWLNQWWQKQFKLVLLFAVGLIVIPIGYSHFNLTQITILATEPEPLVVVQDRGKTILVNTATDKVSKYQVLPFLVGQGINQIDYGVDINSKTDSNWSSISDRLSIENFVNYSQNNELGNQVKAGRITTKSCTLSYETQLSALKLETATHIWLILTDLEPKKDQIAKYLKQINLSVKPFVLVANNISSTWLSLQPQTIISSDQLTRNSTQELDKIKLLNLKRDGVIYWTTNHSIQPVIAKDKQGNYLF